MYCGRENSVEADSMSVIKMLDGSCALTKAHMHVSCGNMGFVDESYTLKIAESSARFD